MTMRIVIALGGNALLRRSDPMTTEVQRRNVGIAAEAIAPLAAEHSIVVVHGNGPQVGLLSLQAESYTGAEPYPLDVLDAGTQGMIGYLIQQELRSLLPLTRQVVTLLTMIVVDPEDPAFASPAKFVGPVYPKEAADALAADKGWAFRQDGAAWRRVVPSPEPQRILEIQPITWLLDWGAVVICAGGGGIPTMYPSHTSGELVGVEAVIDKDLASELLAEDVNADLFLMATDVDGVYLDWGTPEQRRLGQVTPEELAGHKFAAGSMGPKVMAAARYVTKTGRRAAIGSLADITRIVAGEAGTNVVAQAAPGGAAPGPLQAGRRAATAQTGKPGAAGS
jgi:carbamate kinase